MSLKHWITLTALLALPGAALAADPVAEGILKQVDTRYQSIKTGWFVGRAVSKVTGAMKQSMDTPISAALSRPGRLRSQMHDPKTGNVRVQVDSTTWTYLPGLSQYIRTQSAPPSPAALPDMLKEFDSMSTRLTDAKFIGEEVLNVNGVPTPCYRIETHLTGNSNMQMDSYSGTFWIDRQQRIVVRDSASASMTPPGAPGPLQVQSVLSFDLVQLDQPLPDSLFVFTPPPGARLVDRFGPPQQAGTANFTGKEATDFTLAAMDGRKVNLKSLRGKVVLIDFWATWCGPCRHEMPIIQKLHQELKAKGLMVYGINNEADGSKVKSFLAENHYTFPTLRDLESEVMQQYQVTGIPTLIVVDRTGKVAAHFVGGRQEADLRAALKTAGIQ